MKTLLSSSRMTKLSRAIALAAILAIGFSQQGFAAEQGDAGELARASLLTLQISQASSSAVADRDEAAFSSLRTSRQQLTAALAALQQGALKQQAASFTECSTTLDRSIATLLDQEGALRRFVAANEKIGALESTLAELSEEILALTLAHQGKPKDVIAATQIMLLNQRLVKNFNVLCLDSGASSESIFLIAKDSRTLHDLIHELAQGSGVLGLAAGHEETRAMLQQYAASFSEVESLIAAAMQDLPQLLASKRVSVAIQEQSGALQRQLLQLLSTRSAV